LHERALIKRSFYVPIYDLTAHHKQAALWYAMFKIKTSEVSEDLGGL